MIYIVIYPDPLVSLSFPAFGGSAYAVLAEFPLHCGEYSFSAGPSHAIGASPVIKIRKNASTDHHRGSKYRRKAVREYQNKGYRQWAEENNHGMRWPGTEGIFSAVKRKFGENRVSRSVKGLEAEGYQRIWIYDYINHRAKMEVKSQD